MASFGLPSPEEVRQAQRQRLFGNLSQQGGSGAEQGARALGALGGLFAGGDGAQVKKAQAIQGIQQKIQAEFGDQAQGVENVRRVGERLADELMKAGFSNEAFGVINQIKGIAPAKQDHSQKNVLRKSISGVTANIRAIDESFKKMAASAKKGTPTDQMSMVFTYMKILDPGSTVREGEYATAKNTTGIPGVIMNMYNQAKDGTLLNPTQVKNFLETAKGQRDASRDAADEQIDNVLQQADQDGISRTDILGKARLTEFEKRRNKKTKQSLTDPGAAERLKRAKALGLL